MNTPTKQRSSSIERLADSSQVVNSYPSPVVILHSMYLSLITSWERHLIFIYLFNIIYNIYDKVLKRSGGGGRERNREKGRERLKKVFQCYHKNDGSCFCS